MPWNDTPKIRDLGDYCQKHKFDKVIVIALPGNGSFEVLSYGKNAHLCSEAARAGGEVYKAIQNAVVDLEGAE